MTKGADREVGAFFFREAELDERFARLDVRLRVVTRGRLRQQLRTLLAERNLNGAISVLVDGLHLSDAVRQHFDDGYRNRLARIRKDASHAGLAANKSNAHDYPLVPAGVSIDACGVARSNEGTLEKRGSKNLRRDARVVLGLELRRLAQPRPISLEINRLRLWSQAKGRAVYAATPGTASPVSGAKVRTTPI